MEEKKNFIIIKIILIMLLSPIIYFFSVKFFFGSQGIIPTIEVCIQIIKSLGNPLLKMKAYLALLIGLSPFIALLIIFLASNKTRSDEYGNARFAKEKDLKEMQINCKDEDENGDEGLIVGYLKNPNPFSNKKKILKISKPLSILMVAPPGSGKSAAQAIPNLLKLNNSVLVSDIKGELFAKTANVRSQKLNNKVLRFDPLKDENTLFFNPLCDENIKGLDFSLLQTHIQRIASVIFQVEKSDHWDKQAKALFEFLALTFIRLHQIFPSHFQEINFYMLSQAPKMSYKNIINKYTQLCQYIDTKNGNSVNFNEYLKKQLHYLQEIDPSNENRKQDFIVFLDMISDNASFFGLEDYIENYARQFSTTPDKEFGSIKSTYDTFTKVFSNSKVANATRTNNFTYQDMRKEKISVYIVVQTEDIDFLAPLIRIFIDGFFMKMMSGEECSQKDKFIYCIMDEFVRFGKMPFLLEAPALCRSYGLIPLFITQSYQQIKECYGEDKLGILRANAGYQIIYTMNVKEDADKISETIGDYTKDKVSTSKGNFDILKQNFSRSKEAYKLVPTQKILNMPENECLILTTGFLSRPIKAQKNYYFKDKNNLDLINECNNITQKDFNPTKEELEDLPEEARKEYLQAIKSYKLQLKKENEKNQKNDKIDTENEKEILNQKRERLLNSLKQNL